MEGIGVVEEGLDNVAVVAPIGSNGTSPAETNLEGLLGPKGSILLSRSDGTVRVKREVHLTPTEFSLLEYLMMHAGRAVPFKELSREVLGYDNFYRGLQGNIIIYVSNLRKKIGDSPDNPICIESVRGVGYRFVGAQNKG